MSDKPRKNHKRARVPGVSIWPQPKTSPRQRYRMSYTVNGKRVTVLGSTDLPTTIELAAEISKRTERVRVGLTKPATERHAEQDRRPIRQHLEDYRVDLEASGCDPKHVRQMHGCAADILLGNRDSSPPKDKRRTPPVNLDGTGAARVSEIVASAVRREVGKVKAERSAATANRYLSAVQAFLNWGMQDGRWAANVCGHLTKYSTEADRRRERRAISVAEVARLIATTEAAPTRGTPGKAGRGRVGPTGLERAMVYKVCVATGLRANEIRHVRVQDLVLEGDGAGIWSVAKRAKNRKRIFLSIPPLLAEQIGAHVAGKAREARAFNVPANTARMLRRDLKDADIPYVLEGKVFDFHGLRHECGAILVSAGASLKAVQQHMRHSKITLTLDTYGHALEDDQRKLRGLIPTFGGGELRKLQRESGSELPQTSANFREVVPDQTKKPRLPAENAVSGEWSDGESNPDLLNAIQPSRSRYSILAHNLGRIEVDGVAQVAAPGRYFRMGGRVILRRRRPTFSSVPRPSPAGASPETGAR